jgi:hypothetical protein
MSEENTNEVIPAVLAEGEAVIPTERVEEFKALVEEIVEASAVVEEVVPEEVAVVEEVVLEVVAEPTITAAEEVVDNNVISSASKRTKSPSDLAAGLTGVAGGVIGTGSVKRKPAVKKEAEKNDIKELAIHSSKNVSWAGIGKVYRGYNIVTKEQAEKWLTREHIRLATPEEVAQEFGK